MNFEILVTSKAMGNLLSPDRVNTGIKYLDYGLSTNVVTPHCHSPLMLPVILMEIWSNIFHVHTQWHSHLGIVSTEYVIQRKLLVRTMFVYTVCSKNTS